MLPREGKRMLEQWLTPSLAICPGLKRLGVCGGGSLSPASVLRTGSTLSQGSHLPPFLRVDSDSCPACPLPASPYARGGSLGPTSSTPAVPWQVQCLQSAVPPSFVHVDFYAFD